MQLRVLTKDDAEDFRRIRLFALRESPAAFSADYAQNAQREFSEFAARIHIDADNFTLGAFDAGRIIGTCGFYRSDGPKLRHKGNVWNMYVMPDARRGGVGRAILTEIISRARTLDDIEQIHIQVVASNARARQLYLSFGFESYGCEPRALKIDTSYYDEEFMLLRLR